MVIHITDLGPCKRVVKILTLAGPVKADGNLDKQIQEDIWQSFECASSIFTSNATLVTFSLTEDSWWHYLREYYR